MTCIDARADFIRLREQTLKQLPKEHIDAVVIMLNGQYHLGNIAPKCDCSEDSLRKSNIKLESLRYRK
jgi:hypothetical protein